MALDGFDADIEHACDLLVGVAFRDQLGHLQFANREALKP
jgi:hypothetical protein